MKCSSAPTALVVTASQAVLQRRGDLPLLISWKDFAAWGVILNEADLLKATRTLQLWGDVLCFKVCLHLLQYSNEFVISLLC